MDGTTKTEISENIPVSKASISFQAIISDMKIFETESNCKRSYSAKSSFFKKRPHACQKTRTGHKVYDGIKKSKKSEEKSDGKQF